MSLGICQKKKQMPDIDKWDFYTECPNFELGFNPQHYTGGWVLSIDVIEYQVSCLEYFN